MSYLLEKKIIVLLLLTFSLLSLSLPESSTYMKEFYPFFGWDLFDAIPIPRDRYDLFLISYGNKRFDPPLNYSEVSGIFKKKSGFPTQYYNLIQDLGRAIITGDRDSKKNVRKKIEDVFYPQQFEYEIRIVNYDQLEYRTRKKYNSEKVIGIFKGG